MTSPYDEFKTLCVKNREYFKNYDDRASKKMYSFFRIIICRLDDLCRMRSQIEVGIKDYDFDKNTPANGYRSFIALEKYLIKMLIASIKTVRKNKTVCHIDDIKNVLDSFIRIYEILIHIKSKSKPGELFIFDINEVEQILSRIYSIDVRHFLGDFIGFQYPANLKTPLKLLNTMFAIFSVVYYGKDSFLHKLLKQDSMICDHYKASSELHKVFNYEAPTVHFWRSFWKWAFLSMMLSQPNVDTSAIVNVVIDIPMEERSYTRSDGTTLHLSELMTIKHDDVRKIHVRLISSLKRLGMPIENDDVFDGTAENVIFHVHGGGFVSQSSSHHLPYLSNWAIESGIPILSVDYSLAPEYPYPTPFEDILYAYIWCLQNYSSLGTKAKQIILVGDSAGATLCLSLTLKCIQLNIRIPDGMVLAYAPVIISGYPSPARMLSLMDTILPFSTLIGFVKAYTKTFVSEPPPVVFSSSETKEENSEAAYNSISTAKLDAANAQISEGGTTSVISPVRYSIKYEEIICDIDFPPLYKKIFRTFLKSVLSAYAENDDSNSNNILWTTRVDNCDYESISLEEYIRRIPNDMFVSPYFASDCHLQKFPPVAFVTVQLDPCLDDCISFARRLRKLQKLVMFEVLKNLPHGFLNLYDLLPEAKNASGLVLKRILEIFEKNKTNKWTASRF